VAAQPAAAEAAQKPAQKQSQVAAQVTAPPKPNAPAKPVQPDLPPVGGTIKPSRVGPAAKPSTRVRTGASSYATSPHKKPLGGGGPPPDPAEEMTPDAIDVPAAQAELPPEKVEQPKLSGPLVKKYVIDEERGSPILLVALIVIILVAAGVVLYSFNVF
jgi:hypothetical protein